MGTSIDPTTSDIKTTTARYKNPQILRFSEFYSTLHTEHLHPRTACDLHLCKLKIKYLLSTPNIMTETSYGKDSSIHGRDAVTLGEQWPTVRKYYEPLNVGKHSPNDNVSQ